MGFTLESVVPRGRSFAEYRDMFARAADNLQLRILGCGDGPAGFNAELTRHQADYLWGTVGWVQELGRMRRVAYAFQRGGNAMLTIQYPGR